MRVFRSYEGWGVHFLASDSPLPTLTAEDLAGKLPPAAAADLVAWLPDWSARKIFDGIVRQEVPLDRLIAEDPDTPTLTDDRPVNEYDLIHQLLHPEANDPVRP